MPEPKRKKIIDHVEDATHVYIGRMPCGCALAASIDMEDQSTARRVGDMRMSGYEVERVLRRPRTLLGHVCGARPELELVPDKPGPRPKRATFAA